MKTTSCKIKVIFECGITKLAVISEGQQKVIAEQGAYGQKWSGWHLNGLDWNTAEDVLKHYEIEV